MLRVDTGGVVNWLVQSDWANVGWSTSRVVHVDLLEIDWFRMSLWGVLLTRGGGKGAENN